MHNWTVLDVGKREKHSLIRLHQNFCLLVNMYSVILALSSFKSFYNTNTEEREDNSQFGQILKYVI